ncbi:UDP-3-O-(3-hydroxymyristoyl)glucosamine N-acyltransferase [compost metagenome]
MIPQKNFTLEQVQQQLQQLEVPFVASGCVHETCFAFKSLRQIEQAGIYFLTAEISNPPKIKKSIILCQEVDFGGRDNVTLQVENPQLVFYRLMEAMVGDRDKPRGIHPTAIIGESCEVSPSAYIGPFCVLEDCVVKAGVKLHSHVTVMRGTTIEEDVTIESHSTIGATGVAWIWDPTTRRRVVQPQIGYTRIKRGSFLGTDVTVVRGSVNETTIIGQGCVIAHGSKIGHGSLIGDECHFANNISIAGNVTLGKQCFLGSGAIVRPQTRIAERTVVGAGAVVVKHIEEPGLLVMGTPATPVKSATSIMSGVPKPLGN